MNHCRTLVALLAALLFVPESVAQDNIRISGLSYLDYAYTLKAPDGGDEGANGFDFRRVYLTTDFDLSDDFSGRVRLEANTSATTTDGLPAPFIKDLYVEWSNSFAPDQDLIIGISPPPSFTVSERVWGYRSLEKTIQDRVKVVSSRDFGVAVRGKLASGGKVRYGLMVANNSGTKGEIDKNKRVYGQIELYPTDELVFTVGGDYASYSDERTEGVNGNAFAGYQTESFTVGLEGFYNSASLQDIEDKEDVVGGSLFARARVNEKVTVIGRFDRVEFTGAGVEETESYGIFGVALRPHANVEFIPNLVYSKLDSDDDALVTGRVTVFVKF